MKITDSYGAPGSYTGTITQVDEKKLRHGYGRFVEDDGSIDEGQYKNDKYHGYRRGCFSAGAYTFELWNEGS